MIEATNDPQKIGEALNWIVSLLNRHAVPYQIVGGLAAKAYGASRPLVDIDIYVPMEKAQAAIEEIKPYITREPLPHLSASWDLVYMALEYHGMYIEIGDSSTNVRFYNHRDQRWEPQPIDYSNSNVMQLYGVEVNIMPRDELISYKAMLERDVDHLDIKEMSEWHKPTFYIAVMVYESSLDAADYEPLYEESFRLIKADSEEDAKEKALSRANEPFSYTNQYGGIVTWSFKQLVAVLPMVEDEFNDGTELYTRFFRNYEAYRLTFLIRENEKDGSS